MEYRIGVYGSAVAERPEIIPLARRIGTALAGAGCTVITGACSGLPYQAAHAAAGNGGRVWGFSPAYDLAGQKEFTPEDDLSIYSRLDFIPRSLALPDAFVVRKKLRNVLSTAACDAGIIISGSWGTLNEFTNLADFGKPIGLLSGSGLAADAIPGLAATISDSHAERICTSTDPEELVARLLALLRDE